MKTSESIKNLTKALVSAQSQMGSASKDSKNPFFKSKYSDLPTVMEVVKGPLNNNGIIVLQPCIHQDGKNFINTLIIHGETGEYISSNTEVVVPSSKIGDSQAFGSAQTYARRFALQAMLFIPSEDLDGEDLQDRSKNTSQSKPVQQAVAQVPKPQADPKALAQAASAPATTNEAARDEAPLQTTVAPLVKSSFRKPVKASPPPVIIQEIANPSQETGDWA